MEEVYAKRVLSVLLFLGIILLSFFILKPILLSIVLGFILAFIFNPLYTFLCRITHWRNFSAIFLCFFLIVILVLPLWFFTPTIIEQSFKIYDTIQNVDFVKLLKDISPSIFASDKFSQEIGVMIHSFITNTINSFLQSLAGLILNFTNLALQFIVVIFTMFYVLRDKDSLGRYIESLLPFSADIKKRIFQSSRDITKAILYEQVVVGFIQGIVLGVGFFLFGVPSALLLTFLALIVGVLPILGPMLIWVPVLIYLIISGNNVAVIGIFLFGLLSSNLDAILRPVLVSRRVKIHSGIIVIGMVGGLLFFGVLGLILGPLILSYLTIILEVYRDKGQPKT